MRKVPEWIGATDDAAIPDRVKLRIWARENGRCHITGRAIMPGDKYQFEHIKSLALGGHHRETNIALALAAPHKLKTAKERGEQAHSDKIRKRHVGIKKPRTITGWKNFRGEPVRAPKRRD